ncbi:MAG: ABC transporter permease [Armatimonadetes bacterium]|nr:ABC transporter permease [Armatimonadota bacterium]
MPKEFARLPEQRVPERGTGEAATGDHARPGLREAQFRRLLRNRAAVAGLLTVLILLALALAAPLLAPHPFAEQHPEFILARPGGRFSLGTDGLGRDVLSRLLYGGRVSLAVGILSQVVILAIGLPVALAAGYFGGWVDNVLMQGVDVLLAIPDLLFAIVFTTLVKGLVEGARGGPLAWLGQINRVADGLVVIIAAVGLTGWLATARLVRGQILALRQQEFVEAARSIGAGPWRIMARHLLPNVTDLIIVTVTLSIPRSIFLEAALSFLGLGIQPPLPSWGTMIADGVQAMRFTPHAVVAPSIVLAATMLAFNFLGDGLRDAYDPRMQG